MTDLNIEKFMTQDEIEEIGIIKLVQSECKSMLKWGLRMFSLGQHHTGDIDEIKYGGRLIILDDGSRWEVDEYDAVTSEYWSSLQKVVIIDDEMYCLDDCEKVSVQKDDS